MTDPSLLEIRDLHVTYATGEGALPAVRGVDLTVDQAVRRAAGHVTDAARSLAPADVASAKGGRLSVELAPRSLTTVVIR